MMNMPDWAVWLCTIIAVLWVIKDLAKDVSKELEIRKALKEEQENLELMDKEETSMDDLIAEDTDETAQDV